MDIRDPTLLCEECDVNMWSLERVDRRKTNNAPLLIMLQKRKSCTS